MKKFLAISAILVLSLLASCTGTTGVTSQPVERPNAITLAGQPMTLLGAEVKVGQKAANFKLVAPYDRVENFASAKEVEFAQSKGKIRLISVVPSLDTPVCDLQTQKFESETETFTNVAFYTISMDLPFAQSRYCGLRSVTNMQVLSDYRDGSFGVAYGALIKELRLLTRAIFIVDQNDIVKYVQYVPEISKAVDFDSALAELKSLVGATALPATTTHVSATAQLNQPAPDFHLKNLAGQTVSLSDFRGKPVLLNFWATW